MASILGVDMATTGSGEYWHKGMGGFVNVDDPADLVRQYTSWVYKCALHNAQVCAAVPLRVYAAGKSDKQKSLDVSIERKAYLHNLGFKGAEDAAELPDHPLQQLLDQPNPRMDGAAWLTLSQLYQELTGNDFTWIIATTGLAPDRLWTLPTQQVHYRKIDGEIRYVFDRSPTDHVTLEDAELIPVRFPNPANLYWGVGPLQAAIGAADLNDAVNRQQAALFRNQARPDVHVKVPTGTPDGEKYDLKTELKAKYSRDSVGTPLVTGADVDIKPLMFAPRDLGVFQLGKMTRDEIAAIFGVPMTILEISASRAEAETHERQYQKHTIRPRLRRRAAAINARLVPWFDDADRLFVAFDDNVPEDREEKRQDTVVFMSNGLVTANEMRQWHGHDPIKHGDERLVPAAMRPAGPVSSAPAAKSFRDAETKQALLSDPLTAEQHALARKVHYVLVGMRDETVRKLEQYGAEKAAPAMPAPGDLRELLFDHANWVKILRNRTEADIRGFVVEGANNGFEGLRYESFAEAPPMEGWHFDVSDPNVEKFIDEHHFKFADRVAKTAADRLRLVMTEGIEAGETMAQIRKRILGDAVMGKKMTRARAEMIARTESSRAMNAGLEESWIQSGVVEAKRWHAENDACYHCREMHGRVLPLGETYFKEGDSLETEWPDTGGTRTLRFNYEEIRMPPLHPHCRCTAMSVLKDEPEEF